MLAAVSGSLAVAIAGCQSRSSTSMEATPTNFSRTDVVASTDCPARFEPLDPYWSAKGPGPMHGFELGASTDEVAVGDDVTFALTNVTDDERASGVKKKFDVQRWDGERWRTVFGVEDGTSGHLDKTVSHDPGEGFEWTLTFSAAGLTKAYDSLPQYGVCSELDPGRYRFVYWGVSRSEGHAIPVELTESRE
ncbi:hypothetical protein G9C85_11665 [Halorubellus sp. JP-L1]|uniref:hypothetical protein n=1 Tax=Halorubellus sp. JP-L1 TaxID=2715753 RepID=UPI00140E152E|nr:hypothetical protein [Halorubellus sp. JP-L1]NHN42278.1 hypothetical protein [Halorubellus sp. JP-L1]